MNELRSRSNADLMVVATSKNYGKSTRAAARSILVERGYSVDDPSFKHLSAGNVPAPPRFGAGSGPFTRLVVRLIIGSIFAFIVGMIRIKYL
jgi:hypothetical protein